MHDIEPFLYCAIRGDLTGMEELVRQGLDLTATDHDGECLLSRLIAGMSDRPHDEVMEAVKPDLCG